jgi:hypothetical protein
MGGITMAWKYVGRINKLGIDYICASTDTKLSGDAGSILYTYDNKQFFINTDGATDWQPYLAPKLTT